MPYYRSLIRRHAEWMTVYRPAPMPAASWEERLHRAFIGMLTATDDDAYKRAYEDFWTVWREKVYE